MDSRPIRLTAHARKQCALRGATRDEIETAVRDGMREPAEKGRWMYRYNVAFNSRWYGKFYEIKQVAPVVAEEVNEIVVITVYTYYF